MTSSDDQSRSSFQSILFERADRRPDVEASSEPDFFSDLNLDQVLEAMTAGREEYDLKPFFYAPLHDVSAVRYRHEILRDLEKEPVRRAVGDFAQRMRRMREHLVTVEKMHYKLQKQAWFRDAVETYCEAARSLGDDLAGADATSQGLRAFREYLAAYTDSARFSTVESEARKVKDDLASVEYSIHIQGNRVRVKRYAGESDYSAEVAATFAKFQQGAVENHLVQLADFAEMNHVEAQVLDCVARLYPEVFRGLGEYCTRHADYLDETIARFDREVQFYVAYLELIGRFRSAGLPFCYPRMSARSKEIVAEDAFDLALANKLVPEGTKVVCNGLYLEDPERVFVVTGPNNGGKTTFARMFGQLHYLASLGLLVPGRNARLLLPDRIFTHFEREEDIETLRGKLEDELVRVHGILEQATSDSVIVMNESFSSTTLNDAVFLGTEVMTRILDLGCLGVYVTFVDELASLGEGTVSMVSQIVPENPAERTFKILRKPADGLAYAWAIAEKYGLTYDRLKERVAP
jgi:DNA mismatch repair protein MutS